MSGPVKTVLVRRIVLLLTSALVVLGAWWLLRDPEELTSDQPPEPGREGVAVTRPDRPPRPSAAYVGSDACLQCHDEIFELYQSHPMGQSLAHVSEARPIEDYTQTTEFLAPSSTRRDIRLKYSVEAGEEGVYHRETVFLASGEDVYEQRVPVHYEVGSGQRGRSYLINRDGILFMSPITWYSEKARWDLSPGYALNNRHFERRIVDGCVTCHAGRMASIEGRADVFESEPLVEEAIGCERCHGPGGKHVAFHNGAAPLDAIDPIVNPVDLEPDLRDAVCFQCHLAGEERILRYGRTHFDFRPGDDVIDIWTVFVHGTGVSDSGTTQAVSQVEQMLSSACYRESSGRFGCVSCHDPHSIPAADQRVSFYRARCLDCHSAGDPECSLSLERRLELTAEDSCIECHMPRIDANDVPHTSQTDHRVLRSYDRAGGPPAEFSLRVFAAEAGSLPDAELERARGIMIVIQAERSPELRRLAPHAIQKLKPWVETVPDDAEAAEMLGAAYALTGDIETAFHIWIQALESNPDNEKILRRLLVTCHDNERFEVGVSYARRLIELNPWNHMYHGRLAHMLAQRGDLDEALSAGERAVELMPSEFWIHGWLAEQYRLKGQTDRAELHEATMKLLLPDDRP